MEPWKESGVFSLCWGLGVGAWLDDLEVECMYASEGGVI